MEDLHHVAAAGARKDLLLHGHKRYRWPIPHPSEQRIPAVHVRSFEPLSDVRRNQQSRELHRNTGTCGPYDQTQIEARQVTPGDVVVFTSGPNPLSNGGPIVGRMYADVWIKTDLPDVDVFVRMTDVYPAPDNRSMLMAQGIQRAAYRNGGACRQPLVPNQARKSASI